MNLHPWQYEHLTADQFLAYCDEARRIAEGESGGG